MSKEKTRWFQAFSLVVKLPACRFTEPTAWEPTHFWILSFSAVLFPTLSATILSLECHTKRSALMPAPILSHSSTRFALLTDQGARMILELLCKRLCRLMS